MTTGVVGRERAQGCERGRDGDHVARVARQGEVGQRNLPVHGGGEGDLDLLVAGPMVLAVPARGELAVVVVAFEIGRGGVVLDVLDQDIEGPDDVRAHRGLRVGDHFGERVERAPDAIVVEQRWIDPQQDVQPGVGHPAPDVDQGLGRQESIEHEHLHDRTVGERGLGRAERIDRRAQPHPTKQPQPKRGGPAGAGVNNFKVDRLLKTGRGDHGCGSCPITS